MKNKRRVPITITCSCCSLEYHGSVCPKCGSTGGNYMVAEESCCNCYAFSASGMSYPSGKCSVDDKWVNHETVCDKFISREKVKLSEHKACMIEIFKL